MTATNTIANQHSSTALPVLDLQQLLQRCLGSLDLADRCLTRFTQKLHAEVECVRACVDADDRAELTQIAHRLKGSAATIAAVGLSQAAAELERYGRGDDSADVAELLQRFLEEADRFLVSVPQIRQPGSPSD